MRVMKSYRARVQAALSELQATISQCYPSAQFAVTRGAEDPRQFWLHVGVDIEDPFDVADLVLERLVELQIEGLPIHIIPAPQLTVRGSTWPAVHVRRLRPRAHVSRPERRPAPFRRSARRRA